MVVFMPGVQPIDLSLWVANNWKRGSTLSAGTCTKRIHLECRNKAGSRHTSYLSFPNAVLSVDTRSLWICLEHSCLVVSKGIVWPLCYSLFLVLSDIYGFFLLCAGYTYAMTIFHYQSETIKAYNLSPVPFILHNC